MPRKGVKMSPEAVKKNNEAIARWKVEHTDNLSVSVRKGKREAYKRLAQLRGTSVSALIQDYLDGECRKEGIEIVPEGTEK